MSKHEMMQRKAAIDAAIGDLQTAYRWLPDGHKSTGLAIDVETLAVETGAVVCEIALQFFGSGKLFNWSMPVAHDQKKVPGADEGGYVNIDTLLFHHRCETLGPLLEEMDNNGRPVDVIFASMEYLINTFFDKDHGRIYVRGKPFDRLQLEALAERNGLGANWFETVCGINHYHWIDARDMLRPFKTLLEFATPSVEHRATDDAYALAINVMQVQTFVASLEADKASA